PQWTYPAAPGSALATSAVSALTSGIARLPERVPASASAPRSNDVAWQAAAIGPAALAGMTPAATSARASAASKSSICWRHATSSQMARMATLDSIGASRGEREVLMMRGPNHSRRPLPIQKRGTNLLGCEYALIRRRPSPSFSAASALLEGHHREHPGGIHGHDNER